MYAYVVFTTRVNGENEPEIPLMSIFQCTGHNNSVSNDYGGTPPCLIISTSFHKSTGHNSVSNDYGDTPPCLIVSTSFHKSCISIIHSPCPPYLIVSTSFHKSCMSIIHSPCPLLYLYLYIISANALITVATVPSSTVATVVAFF